MRVFETLREAASEIERDIAKSPTMISTRVQDRVVQAEAHEALCYTYTVQQLPRTVHQLFELGVDLGKWLPEEEDDIVEWLWSERSARTSWDPGLTTEVFHPQLRKLLEGAEPSYTYTDRLRGSVETLVQLLLKYPDTRRGFWPIFHPEDSVRSIRQTRIPCSLGYQILIRQIEGIKYLHLVYMERSCDFDRFWLTDLWLAREFQHRVLEEFRKQVPRPQQDTYRMGHLTHFVVSLHSFNNEEVY